MQPPTIYLRHLTRIYTNKNVRLYCALVNPAATVSNQNVLQNGVLHKKSLWSELNSRHYSKSTNNTTNTPTEQKTQQNSSSEGALQKSILEEVLIHEKRKPTTFGGKVAEKASNTFMYTAVIAGIGLIGAFIYVLAGEFFAEDSPQTIFNKALALVRDDGRCQDLFGPTIAGFGEETSRGRRRHVAHHKYEKDGRLRIRVLFHVKGERDEGIAQAEMEQRDGEWVWRFLYVENKRRPKTTHVLIDNR